MGILPLGHIARIISSLNTAKDDNHYSNQLSSSTESHTKFSQIYNKEDIIAMENLLNSLSPNNCEFDKTKSKEIDDSVEEFESLNQRKQLLMDSYISFSAHYLGSMEISNVEGAEDCRRAMLISKVFKILKKLLLNFDLFF